MSILMRVGVNAVAIWAATFLIPGISVSGRTGDASFISQAVSLLVVGAIFGLLNAFVKPLVKMLSLPLLILSLGLFSFIINAGMLQLTSWVTSFTPLTFHIDTFFWDAILGSIVVSLVSMALNVVVGDRD